MKQLLVTGGAGFIGSNFIRYMLTYHQYKITNVDALTYAGNLENLSTIPNKFNYRFFKVNLGNKEQLKQVFDRKYDAIINFAAESHVDRSIENATSFIETNINGSHHLLEFLKNGYAKKLIQISTDEVYGSLLEGDTPFTESSAITPNNPYSASKAAADLLTLSFYRTHDLPVIVTRCSNNYGPYQHREKFIPSVIVNALNNKEIPIYGNGQNIRDWIFVEDHCRAIYEVLVKGEIGEIYNIGGSTELRNVEIASMILDRLKKPTSLLQFVEDRKGHDYRYAINWNKLNQLTGWQPKVPIDEGIRSTIEWYKNRLQK